MDDEKKYYWLKLKKDFFKRHDIRIVEEMPNGKDYVLFYLKLLVESIDHEGELRFSETIPYNENMLSIITNTNIDIVRSAMKLFIDLKMIDVLKDETIYMSEIEKLIGNETASAERVRKHRAKLIALSEPLQCNIDVTKCNTEKEIEKEPDTEKETKKDDIPAGKPATKKEYDALFQRLWEAYPRKDAKVAAERAWKKLKVTEQMLESMITAIEYQNIKWQNDGGKFVPYLQKWLNTRRWEDEIPGTEPEKPKAKDDY